MRSFGVIAFPLCQLLCTLCLGMGSSQVHDFNRRRDACIGMFVQDVSNGVAHQDTKPICSSRRNCGQHEKLTTPCVLQLPVKSHGVDESQRQKALMD